MAVGLDNKQVEAGNQIHWVTNRLFDESGAVKAKDAAKAKELQATLLIIAEEAKEETSPPLESRVSTKSASPVGEMGERKVVEIHVKAEGKKEKLVRFMKGLGSFLLSGLCAVGGLLAAVAKAIGIAAAVIIGIGLVWAFTGLVTFSFVGFIFGPSGAFTIAELVKISLIMSGVATAIAIPLVVLSEADY